MIGLFVFFAPCQSSLCDQKPKKSPRYCEFRRVRGRWGGVSARPSVLAQEAWEIGLEEAVGSLLRGAEYQTRAVGSDVLDMRMSEDIRLVWLRVWMSRLSST